MIILRKNLFLRIVNKDTIHFLVKKKYMLVPGLSFLVPGMVEETSIQRYHPYDHITV